MSVPGTHREHEVTSEVHEVHKAQPRTPTSPKLSELYPPTRSDAVSQPPRARKPPVRSSTSTIPPAAATNSMNTAMSTMPTRGPPISAQRRIPPNVQNTGNAMNSGHSVQRANVSSSKPLDAVHSVNSMKSKNGINGSARG